jgi:hypothetical protein
MSLIQSSTLRAGACLDFATSPPASFVSTAWLRSVARRSRPRLERRRRSVARCRWRGGKRLAARELVRVRRLGLDCGLPRASCARSGGWRALPSSASAGTARSCPTARRWSPRRRRWHVCVAEQALGPPRRQRRLVLAAQLRSGVRCCVLSATRLGRAFRRRQLQQANGDDGHGRRYHQCHARAPRTLAARRRIASSSAGLAAAPATLRRGQDRAQCRILARSSTSLAQTIVEIGDPRAASPWRSAAGS